MATFKVGDQVVVTDEGNNGWTSGKTGCVVFVQSNGLLLVEGINGAFLDAVTGWPAYHPDQLRHASHTN
ncbi:hypothetical protein ABZX98_19215 [Streptomyces sp. NPDC002992]|uniref:hypothetical protein n=1 Tax=Streptomyces sp. NPDC002992 TaxID=3154273 RepID=UPI0033BC8D54